MRGREISRKGEDDLGDLELDIDALRHAVVHRLDACRDGAGGDGRSREGDEAVGRAEGDRAVVNLAFSISSRNLLRRGEGGLPYRPTCLAEVLEAALAHWHVSSEVTFFGSILQRVVAPHFSLLGVSAQI